MDQPYRHIRRAHLLNEAYRSIWLTALALFNISMFLGLLGVLILKNQLSPDPGIPAFVASMIMRSGVTAAVVIALTIFGNISLLVLNLVLPGRWVTRVATSSHRSQASEL